MKTFKVIREINVGEKTYFPGDTVKETDDRDWGAIERLGLVIDPDKLATVFDDADIVVPKQPENAKEEFTPKKIENVSIEDAHIGDLKVGSSNIKSPEDQKEPLTNLDNSATNKPNEPVIKQAGPAWVKVYLGDEVLGKAVRTKEEAQEIIDEWRKNKK